MLFLESLQRFGQQGIARIDAHMAPPRSWTHHLADVLAGEHAQGLELLREHILRHAWEIYPRIVPVLVVAAGHGKSHEDREQR